MKDSSVGPAGLFDTRRQRRLLNGLAERFTTCVSQQRVMQLEHARQRADEEVQFSAEKAETTAACRDQRRNMLQEWDRAEEQLTSQYEALAIQNRKELNRLSVIFRRKAAEEKGAFVYFPNHWSFPIMPCSLY